MPLSRAGRQVELKTVIYATDFSLCCQNAGLYASRIASRLHVPLIVAHAFTLTQAAMEVEIDPVLVSQQRKDLEFLLERKTSQLSTGSSSATPVLLAGAPKDVIPQLADSRRSSLIVLGTHGGGWMQRSIIGSVAEEILRTGASPALTVGPQVAPPQAVQTHSSGFSTQPTSLRRLPEQHRMWSFSRGCLKRISTF
jgi:nucleotide-binding universal stress UspA family protein